MNQSTNILLIAKLMTNLNIDEADATYMVLAMEQIIDDDECRTKFKNKYGPLGYLSLIHGICKVAQVDTLVNHESLIS